MLFADTTINLLHVVIKQYESVTSSTDVTSSNFRDLHEVHMSGSGSKMHSSAPKRVTRIQIGTLLRQIPWSE